MLGNRCGGRCYSALVGATLVAFALAAPAAAARGPIPEELQGEFRGPVTGAIGELSGEFTMVLQGERRGFTMAWPGHDSISFQKPKDSKMFRAVVEGRVLDGDPAYWARLEDGSLIVYSMRIGPHGGYDIYTYIYTPVEDGVDLVVRHLRSGSGSLESKARLKRYGR